MQQRTLETIDGLQIRGGCSAELPHPADLLTWEDAGWTTAGSDHAGWFTYRLTDAGRREVERRRAAAAWRGYSR